MTNDDKSKAKPNISTPKEQDAGYLSKKEIDWVEERFKRELLKQSDQA